MQHRKMPGLIRKGETWHIEKRTKYAPGGRLRESTGTSDYEEAERYLVRRLEQLRQAAVYGVRPTRTFEEVATQYLLANEAKDSILDDAMHLQRVMEVLGRDMPIEQIHAGTLQRYIQEEKKRGLKTKSINNALGVVRHMLNQAASEWMDEHGLTWLKTAPKIKLLKVTDAAKPYPLSFDEQSKLVKALPAHLQRMVLYKANTGTREQEVCGLRWDWEVAVPEMKTSVFIVPGEAVKNDEDRLVVHNRIASSIIEERRALRPTDHEEVCAAHNGEACNCAFTYVFTFKGKRIGKMNNTAWKRAWRTAGLPVNDQVKRGVHNLKHTFGRRLRAAGVPYETRQVLLGHKNGDLTTHYSAAELGELIDAAELVCGDGVRKTPALVVLKRKTA